MAVTDLVRSEALIMLQDGFQPATHPAASSARTKIGRLDVGENEEVADIEEGGNGESGNLEFLSKANVTEPLLAKHPTLTDLQPPEPRQRIPEA